jgi:hypothetical protein
MENLVHAEAATMPATSIPKDLMSAAVDMAYKAETGVVVGSFPGAVWLARAMLAERERCESIIGEQMRSVAELLVKVAVKDERKRCKQIAEGYATSPTRTEAENFLAGEIADKIGAGA